MASVEQVTALRVAALFAARTWETEAVAVGSLFFGDGVAYVWADETVRAGREMLVGINLDSGEPFEAWAPGGA